MLYFFETEWTLRDIAEVSAVFGQECDQAEYEAKIAGLIRLSWTTDREGNQNDLAAWKEAVRKNS